MLEFKSIKKVISNNKTIFIVNNDKDRKINGKGFDDIYPNVKIDDIVYKTKKIECMNISFVNENDIIGIVV